MQLNPRGALRGFVARVKGRMQSWLSKGRAKAEVRAVGEGAGSHNTQTGSPSSRGLAPLRPTSPHLAGDVRTPLVTSRSGPGGRFHAGPRAEEERPLAAREADPMKPVAPKLSPPKLFGACAPPRGALVAMDTAAAAAAGAVRAGSRGHGVAGSRGLLLGHHIQGSRGVGPSSQAGRHYEVSKEGIPPQDNSKQILGGCREPERLALAAWGAQEPPAGAGVLGWDSRPGAWRMG